MLLHTLLNSTKNQIALCQLCGHKAKLCHDMKVNGTNRAMLSAAEAAASPTKILPIKWHTGKRGPRTLNWTRTRTRKSIGRGPGRGLLRRTRKRTLRRTRKRTLGRTRKRTSRRTRKRTKGRTLRRTFTRTLGRTLAIKIFVIF